MGLDCQISQSSAARKTKAQLQKELEAARGGLASEQLDNGASSRGSPVRPIDCETNRQPPLPPLPPQSSEPTTGLTSLVLDSVTSPRLSVAKNSTEIVLPDEDGCSSQHFEGQEIASSTIYDCFVRSVYFIPSLYVTNMTKIFYYICAQLFANDRTIHDP